MDKKPSCGDFIIAVMRDRRAKPSAALPDISKPMSLDKVWKYVKHHYTEKQFRRAMNKLLANAIVVGVWRKWESGVGTTHIAVETIAPHISIEQNWTHLNAAGEAMESNAWNERLEGKKLGFLLSKFYICEDGVPKVAQKIIEATSPDKKAADQILASMQK